jgi:GNAT superfamily N-acetyltransferase
MSMNIALTLEDQAECFAVRERVFVQEQGVPQELEMDALDTVAVHFLWRDDSTGEARATARLLDKGQGTAKIGRVAVLAPFRGQGLGRELMLGILAEARRRWMRKPTPFPFMPGLAFSQKARSFWTPGSPIIICAGACESGNGGPLPDLWERAE